MRRQHEHERRLALRRLRGTQHGRGPDLLEREPAEQIREPGQRLHDQRRECGRCRVAVDARRDDHDIDIRLRDPAHELIADRTLAILDGLLVDDLVPRRSRALDDRLRGGTIGGRGVVRDGQDGDVDGQ